MKSGMGPPRGQACLLSIRTKKTVPPKVTKDKDTSSVALNWKTRFYSPPLAFNRSS